MKLLLIALGLLTFGVSFSQGNEERMVYITRNFPTKELTHNASIYVSTPYYSGTDKNGPFNFSFQTDADINLVSSMKEVLLQNTAITEVSVVKNRDLYTFNITSNIPPENKLWVAGLYYSLGFETIVVNGLEIDVVNYRKLVRNK
ncbi:MAG: hypothetical protein MK078_12390 [Crocinitomicaceae bacterium]|nr:hypothetical protein [Crocinitomicaceae bacterium]